MACEHEVRDLLFASCLRAYQTAMKPLPRRSQIRTCRLMLESILSSSLFVGWVLIYILKASTTVLLSLLGHVQLYGEIRSCKCSTIGKCGFGNFSHSYLTASVYILRLKPGNKRREPLQRSETPFPTSEPPYLFLVSSENLEGAWTCASLGFVHTSTTSPHRLHS